MSEYDTQQDDLAGTELDVTTSQPLGTGEFGGPDIGAIDAHSSRSGINTGSLVIAAVVIVAAGTLFVMRTISKVSGVSSDPETAKVIDDALEVIRGGPSGTGGANPTGAALQDQHVLDVLGMDRTESRVPLDGVQFNPFLLDGEDEVRPDKPDKPIKPPTDKKALRKAEIEAAGEKIVLKSVMMGNPALASLNGKIVREGDTFMADNDVEFVVEWIDTEEVHLLCQEFQYPLEVKVKVRMKRN